MTQTDDIKVTSQTLYRKYRPQTFDDVLGQNEVITVLQNSITNKSISHSYLFSGTRGTGKTSIARIFAKELGTSDQDIYEIDAASNTGVDNIRDLRDGVATRPFNSDYKVYIIDEVHMLSKNAFNALLKTLEEPPSHVLFILATTEKHKVLDTIISRCQVFDFKSPGKELLLELINITCKKEKRTIDQESAGYIASLGNGSFRDTLSHLQKVFSYIPGDITIAELSEKLQISDKDMVADFVNALGENDTDKLFAVYHQFKDPGIDIVVQVEQIVNLLRKILLVRYSSSYKEHLLVTTPKDEIMSLQEHKTITSKHLKDMLSLQIHIEQHPNPHALFEVFLFELADKE